MTEKLKLDRRNFLKQAAGAVGAVTQVGNLHALAQEQGQSQAAHDGQPAHGVRQDSPEHTAVEYPRRFRGRQLRMISFPLGGVAAGSIGLGGRGQLVNWEIFNKPNKGFRPSYAFPAIWAQAGSGEPVARVLESRILPPYEGWEGLGASNAPGLSRLEAAAFTGEYPLAHIDFEDRSLPVQVELDAFSPFIPHEPDDSGLPVAILRYRVSNPGHAAASVSIAFSIDNPIVTQADDGGAAEQKSEAGRRNQYRGGERVAGLTMSNPALAPDDPMCGELVLAASVSRGAEISHWEGWPEGRWQNPALHFWDRFAKTGDLGAQSEPHNWVGVLCVKRTIPAGQTANFEFFLGWRFANRTPDWIGWDAPEGEGKTVIGNFYSARFQSAWEAVEYTAAHLPDLEARMRLFTGAMRVSTLPAAVKEAASANLSTLATTTCFRTADGEFHAWEGSGDTGGCCFGNCTHVWNYETATAFLFPQLARSLRRNAFGYAMDDAGAIHFRQLLPAGKGRFGYAAADGQMGQILHACLDWRISGDQALLQSTWPRAKKALEFAWSRRVGRQSRRRDGRCATQHLRRRVLRAQPHVWNLLSGSIASRRGDGARRRRRGFGTDLQEALRAGQPVDRRQPIQRRVLRATGAWIPQGRDCQQPSQRHGLGEYRDARVPARIGLSGGSTRRPIPGRYLRTGFGVPGKHPRHVRSLYRYNYKRSLEQ